MPVHPALHVRQQLVLLVHLVAHLDAQHALPPHALAQRVELRVLLAQHLLVVVVDLLVRELVLARRRGLVRVPLLVGEERGAVRGLGGVFSLLLLLSPNPL